MLDVLGAECVNFGMRLVQQIESMGKLLFHARRVGYRVC